MECLTPTFPFDIFMDNYFTSFRLLTHLVVNNIWAIGVLNKNRLLKCTGDKQLQKTGTWQLWTAQYKSSKKKRNLCGWLEWQQSGLHIFFWILSTKENCSVLEQSWKKVYSWTITKSIPLLQPEHGFCQQNRSERGQVQDWYPNEKMVVVPVCLNGTCCSLGCVVIVLY